MGILIYITISPIIKQKREKQKTLTPHGNEKDLVLGAKIPYTKIAVTVDFSDMDEKAINSAIGQGGTKASYCLIHIVETAGAFVYGKDSSDLETLEDKQMLDKYQSLLIGRGYDVSISLGFGNPKKEIPILTKEFNADLLVMGVHGHNTFMDLILGTTVEKVRHDIGIPLLIVNK